MFNSKKLVRVKPIIDVSADILEVYDKHSRFIPPPTMRRVIPMRRNARRRMHRRAVHVNVNPVNVENIAIVPVDNLKKFERMTDDELTYEFWNIINSFRWRTLDDGAVDIHFINGNFERFTDNKCKIFKCKYDEYSAVLETRLEYILDGNPDIKKEDFISHIIATGRICYDEIINGDTSLAEWYANEKIYQSLYYFIPDKVKNIIIPNRDPNAVDMEEEESDSSSDDEGPWIQMNLPVIGAN